MSQPSSNHLRWTGKRYKLTEIFEKFSMPIVIKNSKDQVYWVNQEFTTDALCAKGKNDYFMIPHQSSMVEKLAIYKDPKCKSLDDALEKKQFPFRVTSRGQVEYIKKDGNKREKLFDKITIETQQRITLLLACKLTASEIEADSPELEALRLTSTDTYDIAAGYKKNKQEWDKFKSLVQSRVENFMVFHQKTLQKVVFQFDSNPFKATTLLTPRCIKYELKDIVLDDEDSDEPSTPTVYPLAYPPPDYDDDDPVESNTGVTEILPSTSHDYPDTKPIKNSESKKLEPEEQDGKGLDKKNKKIQNDTLKKSTSSDEKTKFEKRGDMRKESDEHVGKALDKGNKKTQNDTLKKSTSRDEKTEFEIRGDMRTESDEHDGRSLDKKNKKIKNSALKKSTSQTEFEKEGDKTPNKKDEKRQKKSNLTSHVGQQTGSEKEGFKTPNEKEEEEEEKPKKVSFNNEKKKKVLSFTKKKGKKEKESNKIKDEQKNLQIKKEEPTEHENEKVIQNTMGQKEQPQEKSSPIIIPFNEQIAQMATSIGQSHNLGSSTSSTPVLQKNPEAKQYNPTNQRLSFSDEISNLATKLGYKDKNEKTSLVISTTATSPTSMPLIPTTSAATQPFTESPTLVSATSSITPTCVTKPVKKPPPPVMIKPANRRYSDSFITHQMTSKPTSDGRIPTMNSSEPITSAPPVSALIFNFNSSVVDTKQTKQETIKAPYKHSTPSSQNMPVTTTLTASSTKLPSQQVSQVQPNSRPVSTDMPTRREPNYIQNPEESTPFRPRPLSEIITKLNYAGVSDPQANFRKPSNTRFSNVDIDSSKKPNQNLEATPSISTSSNTDMLTGVVKDRPPGTILSNESPHTYEQNIGKKESVSSLIGKFDDTFNKPQFQKINPEPIYEEIDDIRKPLPTNNNYINSGQNEPIYEGADETIYENWDIEGGTTAVYETPATPLTLNTNMYEGDYVNIPEHNVN